MLADELIKVTQWLREKVKETGAKGLVVGLSGGIDSAVAAALVKKACPDCALGIYIGIDSNTQDQKDAKLIAKRLELAFYEVDLTVEHAQIIAKSYSGIRKIGKSGFERQAADANLRARLRMSTIYTAANALNYLVIGTDNKAEYHLGYFTKYGDGACDLMPLVNFTKTEVRFLAQLLNIPENIINKTPSAGLWAGQTDESELGITYKVIDAYLQGESIPEGDKQIIEHLHTLSAHKRTIPAVYIR